MDGLDPFRGLLSLGLDFMALSLEDFQFCSGLPSWDPLGVFVGLPIILSGTENPHPKTDSFDIFVHTVYQIQIVFECF